MNFAPQLVYFEGVSLTSKVANYVFPSKEQRDAQGLVIDTWNRYVTLPDFYYNFFMEVFMIPAYTCDKMSPKDLAYPGFNNTYSCYCNNGDYHTMPPINFEMTGRHFQYDMDPSAYMFLPYLNYTQPMSLCLLSIQKSPDRLLDGNEYISLGQRAMATFPFYAIFDRENNTITMELGNAQE